MFQVGCIITVLRRLSLARRSLESWKTHNAAPKKNSRGTAILVHDDESSTAPLMCSRDSMILPHCSLLIEMPFFPGFFSPVALSSSVVTGIASESWAERCRIGQVNSLRENLA